MKKSLPLLVALLLTLTACSSSQKCIDDVNPQGDQFDPCDPAKPVNEAVFSFNLFADEYLIGPVAHTYHHLPDEVRGGIDNVLGNLGEPMSATNSLLQGDMQSFGTTLFRFLLNSTFGFAGIRDFAGENGLKQHEQHFNDTLASYGVDDGAYVVLPLLGPSSVRDTSGKVVDWFLDPMGLVFNSTTQIGIGVMNGIDTRDGLDPMVQQLYYDSLDPYAAVRAASIQHQIPE